MSKIYKFGFWVLIVSTFTFFNVWHITKNSCEKENVKCKGINEKRISTLMMSNILAFRKIRSLSGENIITKEIRDSLLGEKTLAILLSEFKCNKCQEKELKRLSSIHEKMRVKDVKIIGITTFAKKNQVAIQRKILKLSFPIYWVDDEIFKKEISFVNEYPQIIYIKDNIILSGFVPIPMDDEFSGMFYNELLKNIEESFQGSYNKF